MESERLKQERAEKIVELSERKRILIDDIDALESVNEHFLRCSCYEVTFSISLKEGEKNKRGVFHPKKEKKIELTPNGTLELIHTYIKQMKEEIKSIDDTFYSWINDKKEEEIKKEVGKTYDSFQEND